MNPYQSSTEDFAYGRKLIEKILQENGIESWDDRIISQLSDVLIRDSRKLLKEATEFACDGRHSDIERVDVIAAHNAQTRFRGQQHSVYDEQLADQINKSELPPLFDGTGLPVPSSGEGTLLTPNWQLTLKDLNKV
eukprot:GDKJ01040459.1.p1 GENE.GDKJ01040459.1~~GDKJ01040459.1.p1  ORF type:complete len:143 (+),score=18.01 GDKJ01040459.1:24-431(+)